MSDKMQLCYQDPKVRGSIWERFMKYASPGKSDNECWTWSGATIPSGYGRLRIAWNTWSAHRVSWVLFNGLIPDGMQVLHSCDNPPCCNPKHLFLGKDADNRRDAVLKGRHPFGEANPISKLTVQAVRSIRDEWKHGATQTELANRFGVNRTSIHCVLRGKTWRRVK